MMRHSRPPIVHASDAATAMDLADVLALPAESFHHPILRPNYDNTLQRDQYNVKQRNCYNFTLLS